MDQSIIRDIIKQNKNSFIYETDEQLTKQTKLNVISLAYSEYLTVKDLMELSKVLETIAGYKSSTNKKKGL